MNIVSVVWLVWFGLVFVSWYSTHSVMHRLIWNSWPQMVFFSLPHCCSLVALRTNHRVQQTHVGSLLIGCEKRGACAGLPRKGKWPHFHVTAQETGGWLLRAVNRKNCTEICSVSLFFEFGAVGISLMLFLSTQARLIIFMPPALWLMVGSSVTRVN